MIMTKTTTASAPRLKRLAKCPSGIQGLDEITGGGLPRGRSILVSGNAGCGKTMLSAEFLVRGATKYGEPGVFMSFEEMQPDLETNFASLGFDLPGLIRRKKIVVDHVRVERSEIQETGEYDLEGLFVRLNHAIDSIGAKRVALDTISALFSALPNETILRAELRRLFRWLKEKGVTAIITGERGNTALTRHGIEEYVSDCVILLDHRVTDRIATRHLRVVKYRGSVHGTNEYPFLIGSDGISVLPITSMGLNHAAPSQRISSGLPQLDEMLGGKGFFRGSSVLATGTPGTGKTSFAAHFAHAAARRGERAMYFTFEESPSQIVRNMRSIGLQLEPLVKSGALRFHAARPTLTGLEMHLATMLKEVTTFRPSVVVVDPLTSLLASGSESDTRAMVTRLVDFLKCQQVSSMFTSLIPEGKAQQSELAISSLMDSWLLLENVESNGERNRGLFVLKSRGMPHSNQVREFVITSKGIDLVETYVGPGGALVGTARIAESAREEAVAQRKREEAERARRALESKHIALEQQIAALRAEFAAEELEARRLDGRKGSRASVLTTDRAELGRLPNGAPWSTDMQREHANRGNGKR
jgi:circadian clock protein KaiC